MHAWNFVDYLELSVMVLVDPGGEGDIRLFIWLILVIRWPRHAGVTIVVVFHREI